MIRFTVEVVFEAHEIRQGRRVATDLFERVEDHLATHSIPVRTQALYVENRWSTEDDDAVANEERT